MALQNGKRVPGARVTTRSVALKLPENRVERLARVLRRTVRQRGAGRRRQQEGVLEYDHGGKLHWQYRGGRAQCQCRGGHKDGEVGWSSESRCNGDGKGRFGGVCV